MRKEGKQFFKLLELTRSGKDWSHSDCLFTGNTVVAASEVSNVVTLLDLLTVFLTLLSYILILYLATSDLYTHSPSSP